MIFCVENETREVFPFPVEELAKQIGEAVLEAEGCPFEASVNLALADNQSIRALNGQYRGVDQETDVLSFPNLKFLIPGVFDMNLNRREDSFDPQTGLLLLGDVMISVEKAREQARLYGHSLRREIAFLVAHSMFHLCGYDHMEEQQARVMEEKQEQVLTRLGITREE